MKGIQVDPARRTVRAQGGLTWSRDAGVRTGHHGRIRFQYGNRRNHVWRRPRLVNRKTRASLRQSPFGRRDHRRWPVPQSQRHGERGPVLALRGGGGNFGIVTNFEYQLHPVGPTLLAGMVLHPMARAREVLRFYREFSGALPDEACSWAALLNTSRIRPAARVTRRSPRSFRRRACR
jgi:hypothetical protein